jgi:ribose 5-phosphate isomerase B
MCIAANKVKGIRAVDVIKSDMASLAKQHNNANVLCLSGRFISIDENIKIVSNFLNTTFEDRHQKRLDKITNYENQ